MRRPAGGQPSRPLPGEAPVPARIPTVARYLTRLLAGVVEPDREPATYAYYETMARLYVSPAPAPGEPDGHDSGHLRGSAWCQTISCMFVDQPWSAPRMSRLS